MKGLKQGLWEMVAACPAHLPPISLVTSDSDGKFEGCPLKPMFG